jgi:hypothetical protein
LRAEIRTSASRSAAASDRQPGQQQQRDDRAVTRCRRLGRLQQHPLLLDIECPRRAARQLFAAHDRGPEPEEANRWSIPASAWLTDAGDKPRSTFMWRL